MRYIQRQSTLARSVHWAHTISCLTLFVTGLLIYVPSFAASLSVDTMQTTRIIHRIMAVIFIAIPLLAMIFSPKGASHFFGEIFAKWTSDDKVFMKKFFPYLFSAKKTHMPPQDEIKSGQRFADWFILLFAVLISISGVIMWAANSFDPGLVRWMYLLHDASMIGLGVFLAGHIYLGAGIFQPSRGSLRLMFGDGKVSEADARYHWGNWADEELRKSDNVTDA